MELIEKELGTLAKEKEKLTGELAVEGLDYNKLQEKSNRIQQIEILVSEKEMRWLELDEMGN